MAELTRKFSMAPYWLFTVTVALTYYSFGAFVVETVVNYPTWLLIGPAEFPVYHKALSIRIILLMVIPMTMGVPLKLLLLWYRPVGVPTWALAVCLGLDGVIGVSTLIIQIPIQQELDEGFSVLLIERLIATDFFARQIPAALQALLFLWMTARAFRAMSSRTGTLNQTAGSQQEGI